MTKDNEPLRIMTSAGFIQVPLPFTHSAALAISEDGQHIAVGSVDGQVAVVDVPRRRITTHVDLGIESISSLAVTRDRFAAAPPRGNVQVWSVESGHAATLPGEAAAVGWRDGVLRVVDLDGVRDWEVVLDGAKAIHQSDSGIAGIDSSDLWLASAHGDGDVWVREQRSGKVVAHLPAPISGVAKAVAFSPDAQQLAVASASGERLLHLYNTRDWSVTTHPGNKHRRLAWTPAHLVAVPYARSIEFYQENQRSHLPMETAPIDLSADAAGSDGLVMLDIEGKLFRIRDGSMDPIPWSGDARAVALHGDRVWVATADAVLSMSLHGEQATRIDVGWSPILDLAVSPSGEWMATGHLDGTAGLHHNGSTRAILEGHTSRVSQVHFADDERVYTGSWDGDVRGWDLGPILTPAETLVEKTQRGWGLSLEEVLAHR